MIDSHFRFMSTSAIVLMCKVTETTLANQEVPSFTQNKNANVEREVTVTEWTALTVTMMIDRPMLHCLPFYLQGLVEDHDSLNISSDLYARLLSQLAGP